MDFRKNPKLKIFYDISYVDLVRDPIMIVEKLYKDLGLEFSDSFKHKIIDWLDENPGNKYGKHIYSLEQFGLAEDLVNAKLHRYIERFNILPE